MIESIEYSFNKMYISLTYRIFIQPDYYSFDKPYNNITNML